MTHSIDEIFRRLLRMIVSAAGDAGQMPEDTVSAGQRLVGAVRAARQRKGWTRENLAHHSGLSWSAITQIETGRRTDIRVSTLVALADALDLSIDYLLARQPSPALHHYAGVFDSDEQLADATRAFVGDGPDADGALLVVASDASREVIKGVLGERPNDFWDANEWYDTPADANRRYLAFTRAAHLSGATWIGIIGQPVWEGRRPAEVAAWTRYESLLNLTFGTWPVNIMCLYDGRSAKKTVLEGARCTHPELIVGGTVERSLTYAEPEEYVTTGGRRRN
jgi:transcriptional regulator with XRE-family HTH domain